MRNFKVFFAIAIGWVIFESVINLAKYLGLMNFVLIIVMCTLINLTLNKRK